MRKLIYILCVCCWALGACTDNETRFDIPMPAEGLSFTPIAGGAVMHYRLPSDASIYNIFVRYEDAFGEKMVRSGSYACDSLIIIGFNEARTGVKASVTLCDRAGVESEPVEVTFDTKDSGPISFFDKLEVGPGWGNTFTISYELDADLSGMVHLFYVGEDPHSKQPDTVLVESFVPTKGETSMIKTFKQIRDSYDIVVRAEDFRGYMVKEKVWANIMPYEIEKQVLSVENFHYPENLSIEDPIYKLGKQYLFNGDLKGENGFGNENWDDFNTYVAGPWAVATPENPEKSLFIIDLQEEKLPAEVRLYAQLANRSFPYGLGSWYVNNYGEIPCGDIWNGNYATKLPNSVTLFGSNDIDDDASWQRIVHFEQERDIENELRWCSRSDEAIVDWFSWGFFQTEEPCYLSLNCPADGNRYRYLKVVINEVFFTAVGREVAGTYTNPEKHVTIQELEIYTAKD